MRMELHTLSKKQDWGTPTAWFNRLQVEFNFTLDVCATKDNAKLPRFWTPEDDALSKSWACERCWCNPPYGRALPTWSQKVAEEAIFAHIIAFLVPASTSTRWFRELKHLDAKFCLLNGKVKFEAPGINWAAPFHSILVIIGDTTPEQDTYLKFIGTVMVEL